MQSRQNLELRQSQQLALTPALQQSIRFLQLSAQDLDVEVAQALLENPLLEREEEYDTEALAAESAIDAGAYDDRLLSSLASRNAGSDDDFGQPETSLSETLSQHLLSQLQLTRASERDRVLVSLLIDELDENGYLPTPLEEMAAVLPPELDIDIDELQTARRLLQSFDPAGVGAASLAECLTLQLDQLPQGVDPVTMACARRLAADHLDLLASGNIQRLCDALECSQHVLRAARALLLRLNPKPGRDWAGSASDYVIPEVIVRKVRGKWVAQLNPAVMPRLRVNPLYVRLISETRGKPVRAARDDAGASAGDDAQWANRAGAQAADGEVEASEGASNGARAAGLSGSVDQETASLQAHIQQAQGLIKSVSQRFETVLRVAQLIVEHQQAFFEGGAQALRPLVLRDIASQLALHESTVSRATRQKYAQTPRGVVELKSFFGSALATEGGEDTSGAAVRSLIVRMIGEESTKKPLSDNQIATRLADSGIIIARRTVAKYREAEGIPAASARKARALLEACLDSTG